MTLRSLLGSSLFIGAWLLAGCPGDDSTGDDQSDDQGTAHATDHGTTDTGNEASETAHEASETGHDASGTTHHGVETDGDDPAVAYCACAFANCHDAYHDKWGTDEMMAQASCLMEAQALPVNGSDIDMGNFIECRQHFCDMAEADESLCPNVLGEAVCI